MADSFTLSDKKQIKTFGSMIGVMAVMCLGIMVLGSLVRATDSGLACPDWPLCFNKLVPVFDFRIFVEWFHRLLAGFLSLFAIYAVVRLFRQTVLRRVFGVQIVFAAILLVVQVILGGLTVLKLLDPKIVSLHLINALALVSLLIWVFVKSRVGLEDGTEEKAVRPIIKYSLSVLTALVFSQVLLGGMVSSSHAGLACPDFPTCHGSWWPEASFLVWLQVSHRYVAFTILCLVLFVSAISSMSSLPKNLKIAARMLPSIVVLQIILGIVNVQWLLPTWASVSHAANALLLYIVALIATLLSHYYGKHSPGLNHIEVKAPESGQVNPAVLEINT